MNLKAMKLHASQGCIEKAYGPLKRYCFEGFPVTKKCGAILKAHFVIVSYISNLPYPKDVLAIKPCVKTSLPCLKFVAGKDTFQEYTSVLLRDVEQVEEALENLLCR